MSEISSYTTLRTWYQRDQFPSEFGVYKILGLIVVPAIWEVVVSIGAQDHFLEYDFVL